MTEPEAPRAPAPPLPMVQREFRGVWVATVDNIDWPTRPGLSPAEQQAELRAILDRAARLCEARAWRDGEVAGYLTFIDHPGGPTWLDGTAVPIHQLNAELPIQLDDATAPEYLRFFCAAVHGEDGAFSLFESPEQIRWLDGVNEEVKERINALAETVEVEHVSERAEEDPTWKARAVVRYSNALFAADFKIQSSGMVEMLNDKPLAAHLDIEAEVFEDGLRTLRPIEDDTPPEFESS